MKSPPSTRTRRDGHYRPAERLLALLMLLGDHRWHTVGYLADHFDVAERSIHRDLDKIENATKLFIERQPGRGIRLESGKSFSGFEGGTEETLNLILAVAFSPKFGLSLLDVARTLDKLRASVPPELAARVDWLYSRVHFEMPFKSRGLEFLRVIRTGIADSRRLRLTHTGVGDAKADQHDVNPFGLVYYHDIWYLLGLDFKSGQRRAFRVDRFKSCALLDIRFTPPDDFDAREYWNRSFWRQYERDAETYVVVFDAECADRVKHWSRVQLKPQRNGAIEATFKSMNPEWVKSFVLSCGEHCTVKSPEWLKKVVKVQAKMTLRRYSSKGIL